MELKKLEEIVTDLNSMMSEYAEIQFSVVATGYFQGIRWGDNFVWDTENDDRAYLEDKEEHPELTWDEDDREMLLPFIIKQMDKYLLELIKVTSFFPQLEENLNMLYTNFSMLADDSWEPEKHSVEASLGNVVETANFLGIEVEDKREIDENNTEEH